MYETQHGLVNGHFIDSLDSVLPNTISFLNWSICWIFFFLEEVVNIFLSVTYN